MTKEEFMLTEKYLPEYSEYCKNRECGDTCPVFVEHGKTPKVSCFIIYCRLRESDKL